MQSLNHDSLSCIFSCLDISEIFVGCSQVCKEWKNLIKNPRENNIVLHEQNHLFVSDFMRIGYVDRFSTYTVFEMENFENLVSLEIKPKFSELKRIQLSFLNHFYNDDSDEIDSVYRENYQIFENYLKDLLSLVNHQIDDFAY
jgi:hypothetical protein